MGCNDVEILDEQWLYQDFFQLKRYQLRHKLFAGGWSEILTRDILDRPPVAGVLPYDPLLKKIVLIEQIRAGTLHTPTPWLFEVVAGVANTPEEPLIELARRETHEEAGLEISALTLIANYWVSPGLSNERVALFCGRVDASQAGGLHGLAAEHEDIKTHVISITQAFEWLKIGKINNAMTLIALQWLQLHQPELW